MDNTIKSLIEIDKQAAAIYAGAEEKKKAAATANDQRIKDFDAQILSDTESRINAQKKESERIVADEAKSLKESIEVQIAEINEYYKENKDALAESIFERITGCKWEA